MDKDWEPLRKLSPEQKAAIAMDMTTACVRICADGIRAQNPAMDNDELISKLKERLAWSKRDKRE